MKLSIASILCVLFFTSAHAAEKFKFSFTNDDLSKMIEVYSKRTGQKFVIDPAVRGKATILLPDAVTAEEAFDQLSSALALNGFAITKRDDTMIVKTARNIQRDMMDTYTDTVPPLKPERMVTYTVTLQNIPVDQVNRDLRILSSKDGEMSVYAPGNQIIFSDWSSNMQRVAALLKQLDKPVPGNLAKVIAEGRKESEKNHLEREKRRAEKNEEKAQ